MLEKIVRIRSIGRFTDCAASGDVTLGRLTLFYAPNGRGKTTLCAVLRSLKTGEKEFITERKTLGTDSPEEVHFRIGGNNHRFANGTWDREHRDILIFDSVFVNENVYSGDYVDHAHKKNLYRVIVGAQGVQLARQVETLDGQIRTASTELRSKRDAVSKCMPDGMSVDDYLQWQPVVGIDDQIRRKTEDLSARQRAAARSGEIHAKGLFLRVELPSLPQDFAAVLDKQLTDVVADAEAKVRQQIARHEMGPQGESWLSKGLKFVKGGLCPFCGQGVAVNDLLAAYRSHFSAGYAGLKQEVAQLSRRVKDAIGEGALATTQQHFAGNAALAEFWKQFTTINLPEVSFADIQERYATLSRCCLALAERKQQRPIEAVALEEEFTAALGGVEALHPSVAAYNSAVDAANVLVKEQKASVASPVDVTSLRNELVQLEARKKRFEPDAVAACEAYQSVLTAKEAIERQKESIRQQLDQHCASIICAYEQSINDYLDHFNAGFRITNTRPRYTGGTPSSHYQIEINSTALDLGDARTPSGTPCFKTALSSGDRSALALAFFLAVLKQDSELGRKILVFDDPFTSLDRFRRTCTQQLIQGFLSQSRQIIVLSHDPHFLKLLSDGCPSANTDVKVLQLSKAGDGTVVAEFDIEAETQSTYLRSYATLLDFYREKRGEPRAVATAIRPFLEGMLRSHFPGHFSSGEWLGQFLERIRAANSGTGLDHAKSDLAELEAINDFSKKYHHAQNPNAALEPIDDDELEGYVKRTLRLVGGV